MARYKDVHYDQDTFIPVSFHQQILPGTFEYTLSYPDLMIQKIDTREGRYPYSRRMGIVEPVFAHICSTPGLNRFSLRTKRKVDIQWKLYCMAHNLLKIHRYGTWGLREGRNSYR